MIDIKGRFSISDEDVQQVVDDEVKHPFYELACDRAEIMNSWFKAEDDTQLTGGATLHHDGSKSKIIQRSKIESDDEYDEKVRRMRLFPLEKKLFESQQRIYDENNVNRLWPEETKTFWDFKQEHFDDGGDPIDVYYRDKVLFVKEELGFGASIVDLMVGDDGKALSDDQGKVIPYAYTVRPKELVNFQIRQGVLTLLVTEQSKTDVMGKKFTEYRAFTRDKIWKWTRKDGETEKSLDTGFPIANPFGEVPATLLKGSLDQDSAFRIGKPRRYSMKGLYMAASELFYDLQKGSLLFGHPIPVYYMEIIKGMAGTSDSTNSGSEFDPSIVKEKVGAAVIIPDGTEPPRQFFYQADMAGLDHLRKVIFDDLMGVIFFLASIREKNQVAHNVSGRAKQFDNLDEQSMLAQTAIDMEAIERNDLRLMAKVRGEKFEAMTISYSKHHDLSTADEIFANMVEAAQYGIKNLGLWRYWVPEYLRKRSAPADVQEYARNEITTLGLPPEDWEMAAVANVLTEIERAVRIRPELLNEPARKELLTDIEKLRAELGLDEEVRGENQGAETSASEENEAEGAEEPKE